MAEQTWGFVRVISHLQALAFKMRSNESRSVQMSAFGLKASES